ncbi:MAG: 50S ribosome-binding GTPase [Anaerolineae bacterium]|nr:50S ribosome-binding GTPase [Anaerolineae bacterium]
MRLGIIGLPNSGKTTLFNALTGQNLETAAVSSGQFELHTAVVNVPDPRVERMVEMYKPKKTVRATINFADIAGMDKGISEGGLKGQFRVELQQVDGFVHVVRAFEDPSVPHPYETTSPSSRASSCSATSSRSRTACKSSTTSCASRARRPSRSCCRRWN